MQSVQRRLSRIRGERDNDEERHVQETKIKQLTSELDEKLATHNVLNEHIKRVNVRTTFSSNSQGSCTSWKVMDVKKVIYQACKVMENVCGHDGKSWKGHGIPPIGYGVFFTEG